MMDSSDKGACISICTIAVCFTVVAMFVSHCAFTYNSQLLESYDRQGYVFAYNENGWQIGWQPANKCEEEQ